MFIYDFERQDLAGIDIATLSGIDAGEGLFSTSLTFSAIRSNVFIGYRIDGMVNHVNP